MLIQELLALKEAATPAYVVGRAIISYIRYTKNSDNHNDGKVMIAIKMPNQEQAKDLADQLNSMMQFKEESQVFQRITKKAFTGDVEFQYANPNGDFKVKPEMPVGPKVFPVTLKNLGVTFEPVDRSDD